MIRIDGMLSDTFCCISIAQFFVICWMLLYSQHFITFFFFLFVQLNLALFKHLGIGYDKISPHHS